MQTSTLQLKRVVLPALFTLLLSMAGVTNAFAQQRVAKNEIKSFKVDSKMGVALGNEVSTRSASNFAPQTAKSVIANRYDDVEDVETMWTYYDLQSNGWVSNRMFQLPNGSVAVAATMSHIASFGGGADRGTGYNFYNAEMGQWQDMPETRVEEVRTGWPTIAQWGDNGEILITHAPLRCWTREVAGQGEWVYKGELPLHPDDYPYTEDASWPRVATSGDHHNIIHVIADIQHSVDVVEHHQVYYRSTDAENWTCTYSPLAQDNEETGHYSADNYNITANGHNVAMIYGDNLQSHVVMYKSTNDGQTWNRTVIWQNPYYGYDWETDPNSIYTDTVFGPASVAIAIDNYGVAHVAMSTYEYMHSELGSNYTTWQGRAVDGIYYWNDTQTAPIQSENGNPHDALRLWWPDEENPGYIIKHDDPTKWIGYIPMYEDYYFDNDKLFTDNDYFYKIRKGLSAWPALSIDPMGNIACAYSAPNITREDSNTGYYLRSIYVSYRNVDEGYWHQAEDDITDPDINFTNLIMENIFTNSVDNTTVPGEFWFSFQSDDQIGCYVGSYAAQSEASENQIHVVKVVHNPGASDYSYISVTANPANGGTVTGSGYYQTGQTCTLTATANENYTFVNWTKNGNVVSINATYNFTVTGTASYVANFMQNQVDNYVITTTANPPEGGTVTINGTTGETLILEPFEEYTVGNKIAASANAAGHDWWTTWSNAPGGSEDGIIVEYDGTKCGHLTYGNDQVFLLGDQTSSTYICSFDMYIPNGKDAYNNLIHVFAGSGSEWASEVYFKSSSYGTMIKVGGNNYSFECPFDTWFNVKYDIDLDNDVATFYIDGQEIVTWQYSLQASGGAGTRQLAAMDFFPPTNAAVSEYYIDNVNVEKVTGTAAPHLVINPNAVNAELPEDDITMVDITIENQGNSIGDWNGWLDFGQGGAGSQSAELYYHNGDVSNALGIGSSDPCTREIAIRLPENAYAGAAMGMRVISAKYYIYDQYHSTDNNYIFRVYGQGANGQPGEVLAEKTVYSIEMGTWITATFDEEVYMTGQTMWIGVQLEQAAGEYPLSMDGGEYGEEAEGNWLRTNGGSFRHCYSAGNFSGAWLITANCQGTLIPATWAYINKTEGAILGGQSETVTLSLNSIGLNLGTSYNANFIINTNDENMPHVEIPVTLNVNGSKSADITSFSEPLPTTVDNLHDNRGSVRISGSFEAGSTCVLTATAHEGYTFTNWTKNGNEVSTNPNYSFTVTENATYVANFSASNTNHWYVDVYEYPYNMSVTGIIQINGVEQQTAALEIGAFCGDECRGSQMLTYFPQVNRYLVFFTLYGDAGDVMSFRLYDHSIGEELNLSCSSTISFVPDSFIGTPFDPYVFDFNMTVDQVSNFSQGYNWWCSYVEQEGINGLGILQEGLGNNGVTIRSQASGYTDYYQGYGWYGSLSSINNESSYRVITSAPCTVTMTGNTAVPSQHPITLSQGWTWIGYVPSTAMSVDAAMANVNATSGDKLKSQQGYADYYAGYGWFGSLNTIELGMGLMYYSTNSNSVTFTYPDSNRGGELKANLTLENNHWVPNIYAYPDNMTLMAVVELDDTELASDNYELAAFANGECRGSVKLMYAEPLHRYVAFLTISGKDAAELSFRLYDTETGIEYYDAVESLDFVADAIVGEANDLYTIHFRGTAGMDELANRVHVYPNPVNAGERFSIGMANDETYPVHVEIVNALGVETLRATSVQMPAQLTAPATAGIYTLRITVEGKGTVVRKLVVK